ncbi:MAG: extracellular solute-binding protein [Clostridia bacterium]|nr:extracellular solute-binding protein [Clostridia bacterium]
MSYLKRALALVLALCFVLVIAACGPKEPAGNNDGTTTTTTAAQGDANVETTLANGETVATGATTTKGGTVGTTTKAPVVETVTDNPSMSKINAEIKRTTDKNGNASASFIKSLKGYTLKIYNPWPGAEPGSDIYQSAAYVETEVEKEFGVEIHETGNWEGYAETVFANITSGRPDADIYKVQDFNYATYVSKKYMANMTKAMRTAGVDMKEPWYNQDARKFFNINDGQYAWAGSEGSPYLIMYNKDMIKKAGLTDPADLVAKKQWTWDQMKKYAEKLNSSSVIGLSCGTTAADFLASMVISSGGSLVSIVNGKPKSNIKSAVVKNCLQTLATWTKNDAVVNMMKGQEMWQEAPKKFAKGELAMILGGDNAKAYKAQKATFTVGVVPFPTPKAGQDYVSQTKVQYMDFIPAPKATSAAKILFIRNEMYRVSYRFWDRDFQIRNKDMFKLNGKEMTDLADITYNRKSYFKTATNFVSLTEKSDATASTSWTVSEVVAGTRTPQAAIDAYGSMIEAEYESVWKGLTITGK